MQRWTILILLFFTLCFAGASYYKVVGVADDDTLSVRKPASNIIYSSAIQYKKNQNIFRVVGVLMVYDDCKNSEKRKEK